MARRARANLIQIQFPPRVAPPFEIRSLDTNLVITTNEVGYGSKGSMLKEDIELVQFLLDEFYSSFAIRSMAALTTIPKTKPGPQTGAIVKIDGVFGNQTDTAIKIYQRDFLGHARPDGIVSVAQTSGPTNITPGQVGPAVTIESLTRARTIVSLAGFWAGAHPNQDMLNASKVQSFALNLKQALQRPF